MITEDEKNSQLVDLIFNSDIILKNKSENYFRKRSKMTNEELCKLDNFVESINNDEILNEKILKEGKTSEEKSNDNEQNLLKFDEIYEKINDICLYNNERKITKKERSIINQIKLSNEFRNKFLQAISNILIQKLYNCGHYLLRSFFYQPMPTIVNYFILNLCSNLSDLISTSIGCANERRDRGGAVERDAGCRSVDSFEQTGQNS